MPEDLVLEAVSKRYGRGPYVIERMSHVFVPGSATGLIGPNGSGKTTLLRLLAALSFPTSGRLRYGDLDVAEHPYRYLDRVALVHDAPDLPEHLSAVEIAEYVLRARGRWSEASPRRFSDLLDHLLLDERRESLVGTYSSGMLRKAQIGLALALEPEVLLLDEPFRGLDHPSTEAAIDLLRNYREGGGTLVVSGHLREALGPLCDTFIRFGPRGTAAAAAS